AAARGRPRARHRAQAAPARRADRGHEPAGDRRLHRLRPAAPRGAGPDRPPDRARHEGGHGRVRPRHRARLRPEDRGGRPRRGSEGPARDRGLSRQGGGGGMTETAGTILELEDVHTYYGLIHALKGVSLEVRDGEIVTLIGANGAGKSTTLRSINGLNRPRRGTIKFQGRDVTTTAPHELVKRGISQSPEGRRLFPRMTVLENLEMGAFQRGDRGGIREDLD